MDELQILEPDELGSEVVYKDGIFYKKRTYVYKNGTTTVYMPIAIMKKSKK